MEVHMENYFGIIGEKCR